MKEPIEQRLSRLEATINEQAIQFNAFKAAVLSVFGTNELCTLKDFSKVMASSVTLLDQLQSLRREIAAHEGTLAAQSIQDDPLYEAECIDFFNSMEDPDET